MLAQGAVKLDGEKLGPDVTSLDGAAVDGKVLQRGKRHAVRLSRS